MILLLLYRAETCTGGSLHGTSESAQGLGLAAPGWGNSRLSLLCLNKLLLPLRLLVLLVLLLLVRVVRILFCL